MFNNNQTLNFVNNKFSGRHGCPCYKNGGCCHPNCKFKNKNCIRNGSAINSLLCVEKFLCCSQKACNFYKLLKFFN